MSKSKSKKKLDSYKIVINDSIYEKKLRNIHNECFNEENAYIAQNMISFILISKKSGRPMCYLLVEPINYTECFIWSVCTGLDYRSRGCIQTLFKRVFSYLGLHGFLKIGLYVSKQNKNAINLYKKMGFSIDQQYIHLDNFRMYKNKIFTNNKMRYSRKKAIVKRNKRFSLQKSLKKKFGIIKFFKRLLGIKSPYEIKEISRPFNVTRKPITIYNSKSYINRPYNVIGRPIGKGSHMYKSVSNQRKELMEHMRKTPCIHQPNSCKYLNIYTFKSHQ